MSLINSTLDIDHKALLEQLLHELRTINHVIKASSEILSKGTAGKKIDRQNVNHHAQVIFENAYLLSLWLDIGDFELHPEIFAKQELYRRSLWGKFNKALLSFRRVSKNRNIKLLVDGESKALLDCYPVIDMLPYLILDNAIKYSPSYGNVTVLFEENTRSVNIEVTSMGPVSKLGEEERLFEHSFRSEAAVETDIQGYGRGLALVKAICDIHDATVRVGRGAERTTYKGVEYAKFSISLTFKRHA